MSELGRQFRSVLRQQVAELDVSDVKTLISYLPRIVKWFRARKHDTKALDRDFAVMLAELDASADRARARLDERFPTPALATDESE